MNEKNKESLLPEKSDEVTDPEVQALLEMDWLELAKLEASVAKQLSQILEARRISMDRFNQESEAKKRPL